MLLLNGTASTGQVAVCVNNTYVSVCYDQWDILDAGVVCRQLGYTFSSKKMLSNSTYTWLGVVYFSLSSFSRNRTARKCGGRFSPVKWCQLSG